MVRPRHRFAWAQVEKLDNGKWKCIHCEEVHSGAASRIRNHLSGQGNGIAACEKADEPIKNKALKKVIQKKRGRGNSSAKFLMCSNSVTSFHSGYVVDPLLREFLDSVVGQHEVQLMRLLRGDPSSALEKSVLRIKHEVEHNMLMLKESRKTTGCTSMVFQLVNYNIVIAMYCPKGIIFVQVQDSDDDLQNCDGYYTQDLKRHSPRLYIGESVLWLRHQDANIDADHMCQLLHDDEFFYDHRRNLGSVWRIGEDHICLRNEVQMACYESCCISGTWAGSLVDIAVKIHDFLWTLGNQSWYYMLLSEKNPYPGSYNRLLKRNPSLHQRLSIFLLIMNQKHALLSGSYKSDGGIYIRDGINAITNGSMSWKDSWKLEVILRCVLKIGDVMDTLVPTAGYFAMALDRVDHTIQFYGPRLGEEALQFWEKIKSRIEHDISRLAASYLNPVYFLQQLEKDPLLPAADKLKKALKGFAEREDISLCEMDEEVVRYADVFRRLSERIELEDHHPVKLWVEVDAQELPVLRRCALVLLSRPLNCMCKQVKEDLYHLRDSEDYFTTLNFRMMRHFQDLGDDIYKPLDLSQLDADNFCKYMKRDDSEQSEDSEQSD